MTRLAALAVFLALPTAAAAQGQIIDRRAYFAPCEAGDLERGWVVRGRAVSVEATEPGECVEVNGASARRFLYARCRLGDEVTGWVGPAVDGDGEVCR